jgi:hypothetical protein
MDATEHKYYCFDSCLFVFIRGFLYTLSFILFSLSYFLILISGFPVYEKNR